TCKPKAEELQLTKYAADGTVRLVIDFYNKGDTSFGEIESIMLYVGEGWEFSQRGQVCPKTSSDDPRFSVRHALMSPVRKMPPGGWSQVDTMGTKRLAWAHQEELQTSYKLSGRIMIRVVTADHSYDFERMLEVDISDIPF